ncbi:TolC family protein [Hymenobacter sp. BT770]|uniref:TolC family protein n=1 Tax=Hymenobacter sp. BT770 TaxID=2886942 RepID=UPI001D11A934|nr:TolC family protein [Hymenobacter sp. BT770]MCC3153189.1 TolC family protein [Hymenobacter sp. BT770]MDO3415337.1 TolC family protein [Hymenobacter sp. BT770]
MKQHSCWAAVFGLGLLLGVGRPARGQERLSYGACVERAFQQNLQLKRALLDLEVATAQLKLQKADRLPTLNGVVRNNNSVGRSVDPLTNGFINRQFNSVSGTVNSSVYLFEGLKTVNAIKAAKQQVEQNSSQVQAVKNDIMVEVALVYIRINYLLELIKSQQQQVQASAQLVSLTKLKLNAGRVAASALFKMMAQQATEQVGLVSSQNELTLAYLDLRQILNAKPTENLQIAPLTNSGGLAGFDMHTTFRENLELAVEAQPALAAKRHNAYRLYNQIDVARADKLPSVQLTGALGSNYSNTNQHFDFGSQLNNNMYYGTGIVLSLPLFNSFRNNMVIRESRLRYEQGLLDADIERNRLTRVIQQAITDAEAAHQSWEAAVKAEEFARKSFEADNLKYQYGTISVFELNQTKAVFLNAQTDLFKAKYELILRSKLVGFYQGLPLML